MSHDLNLGAPPIWEIQRQVLGLRREIALAKSKRTGIDAAIKSREQSLARLEAQLALAGGATRSAPFMSGVR
jgi:hypothetical protein